MDGTESENRLQPKPLIDLLPALNGIFTRESKTDLTNFVDMVNNRTTLAIPSTAEKNFKPRPFNALTPYLAALEKSTPVKASQTNNTKKKKNWNSSVKVNKTIGYTSNKQLPHSSVRKVLKFVPKSKPSEPINNDTTKFLKPELRTKPTTPLQGKALNCRISGITNISKTPATQCNPKYNNRFVSNKENNSNLINKTAKPCTTSVVTPKMKTQTNLLRKVPETPLTNDSWKSSCDASFLEIEKEIEDANDKISTFREGQILEDTLNGLKPELFNNSMNTKNYICENKETITCFDKVNKWRKDNQRDERDIVSLCEKLKEAKVNDCCETGPTIENELENKNKIDDLVKIFCQVLQSHIKDKESKLKYYNYFLKSINEKMSVIVDSELKQSNQSEVIKEITEPELSSSSIRCSVIISSPKSPSYKIPKRTSWLRKKINHKSVPSTSSGFHTPKRCKSNKALDMYMQMKEELQFLKTPMRNYETIDALNTPTTTSRNLQKQLDKLYNYS